MWHVFFKLLFGADGNPNKRAEAMKELSPCWIAIISGVKSSALERRRRHLILISTVGDVCRFYAYLSQRSRNNSMKVINQSS